MTTPFEETGDAAMTFTERAARFLKKDGAAFKASISACNAAICASSSALGSAGAGSTRTISGAGAGGGARGGISPKPSPSVWNSSGVAVGRDSSSPERAKT